LGLIGDQSQKKWFQVTIREGPGDCRSGGIEPWGEIPVAEASGAILSERPDVGGSPRRIERIELNIEAGCIEMHRSRKKP